MQYKDKLTGNAEEHANPMPTDYTTIGLPEPLQGIHDLTSFIDKVISFYSLVSLSQSTSSVVINAEYRQRTYSYYHGNLIIGFFTIQNISYSIICRYTKGDLKSSYLYIILEFYVSRLDIKLNRSNLVDYS